MKQFIVSFGSYVTGCYDCVVVLAKNKSDATKIGKQMLRAQNFIPSFSSKHGIFSIREISRR